MTQPPLNKVINTIQKISLLLQELKLHPKYILSKIKIKFPSNFFLKLTNNDIQIFIIKRKTSNSKYEYLSTLFLTCLFVENNVAHKIPVLFILFMAKLNLHQDTKYASWCQIICKCKKWQLLLFQLDTKRSFMIV